MKKRILSLALAVCLCFCFAALAEEDDEGGSLEFRSLPGYTCYPLIADGNYPGNFCVDCPMEWDGGDYSNAYAVPTVIAIDPENQSHHVLISELSMMDQLAIMQDDNHPLAGFYSEGFEVVQGRSTEGSKLLEQFSLHGLPAFRVEMVGQGYEMIWVLDRPEGYPVGGDLWFFMYPADPEDAEYMQIVSGIVDSFTVYEPYCTGTAPASDFEYEADGDGIRITAYTGSNEYVKVPAEIDGKPVISMGDRAFYETDVRHVSLPASVQTMGSYTFGGCTHLVFTVLPEALEVLPAGTFESCFRLIEPGLNDGLKKIEAAAFWGTNYLTELYLPDSLEEIEDGSFVMCEYLAYILAGENSQHFRNEDDYTVLLSADGTKLIHCSYQREGKEYRVPDGVKQIYAYAFNRVNLTGGITLPEGLEYIGFSAFTHTGLTELHIPESTTEIGVMQNVYVSGSDEPTTAYVSVGESIRKIYGKDGSPAMTYAELQSLEFVAE